MATPAGDFLDEQGFRALITEHAGLGPEDFADTLLHWLAEWSGRRGSFDDDLTLLVPDVG